MSLATLRQLLTCPSQFSSLGSDSLLQIQRVTYSSEPLSPSPRPKPPVFLINYEVPASPPSNIHENPSNCPICKWNFPAYFTYQDRERHIHDQNCLYDKMEYRKLINEVKKMSVRLSKEPLNTAEDGHLVGYFRGVGQCPVCGKDLEGLWSQFKQVHIEDCGRTKVVEWKETRELGRDY